MQARGVTAARLESEPRSSNCPWYTFVTVATPGIRETAGATERAEPELGPVMM